MYQKKVRQPQKGELLINCYIVNIQVFVSVVLFAFVMVAGASLV